MKPPIEILKKINISKFLEGKVTDYVFGPSSEIFVGSFGYPKVYLGPLASLEDELISTPSLFNLSYDEIIQKRSLLVRGTKQMSIRSRIQTEMAEVALSTKPIDVEEHFTKKPNFEMVLSSIHQPIGASAPLKSFRQAENPVIPKKVDSIINEDILANDAISELLSKGFDNYYITKIFSIGTLGKEENKKIVPTKWSITALDDIIGKQRMDKIREFPEINQIMLFYFKHLGNSYHILLLPGVWEFENFESWYPHSEWSKGTKEFYTSEEYEPFEGRTAYAASQVGGYYASRFAVVKYLFSLRKQARVVAIREIDETYTIPLGVAQVREGVNSAMRRMPLKFDSKKEAVEYLSKVLKVSIKKYLSKSMVLRQTKLTDFLRPF